MVEVCALASGSNGNSYYIGNEKEAVLIDAGIFYKRLNERLTEANLEKSKIKAIFISHEHADHVQGVRVTTKKLEIPAIFSRLTFQNARRRHRPDLFSYFEPGVEYKFGNISVFPFLKKHDAIEPCSFRVETGGTNIGVFTDIGQIDDTLINEFQKCDAVFLETNYDKEMLWNGQYPYYIKQRVDSDRGHLSNEQALELVQKYATPKLKHIFLSHISDCNNTYNLAKEVFSVLNGKYNILLTSREGISEIIRL
jgi:phosphoribosyl 1,2-cyclic phosphodiesterase